MAKTSDSDVSDLATEISQLLKTTGLTAAAASRAIGRGKDYLRDILDGRKLTIKPDDLQKLRDLAQADKEISEQVAAEDEFPEIAGKVSAGVWIDVGVAPSDTDRRLSPIPFDPRYPRRSQYDLCVEGNSINRFARDGALLRCVDIVGPGIEIRDGDYVIVRRTAGLGTVETTAKRLRLTKTGRELWPDSDDPRYQTPIIIPNGGEDGDIEVQIVALVLYQFSQAR